MCDNVSSLNSSQTPFSNTMKLVLWIRFDYFDFNSFKIARNFYFQCTYQILYFVGKVIQCFSWLILKACRIIHKLDLLSISSWMFIMTDWKVSSTRPGIKKLLIQRIWTKKSNSDIRFCNINYKQELKHLWSKKMVDITLYMFFFRR